MNTFSHHDTELNLFFKGFSLQRIVDFDEIFFLVVNMFSIYVVLDLTASLNLEIKQIDVKIVFIHYDLKEDIHIYIYRSIREFQGESQRSLCVSTK